jgi:hypothetical protein
VFRAIESAESFVGGYFMRFIFLMLAILMVFVWIGAFLVFHVAALFIHIFLVLALVFLVIHLISGRQST